MGHNTKVRDTGLGSGSHGFLFGTSPSSPRGTNPAQPSPPRTFPSVAVTPSSRFSPSPQILNFHHLMVSPGVPRPSQPQHPLSSSSSPQYFPKDQLENDFSISEIHQGKQFPSFIPRSKPELTFFLLHFPLTQPFFSPFLSSHCFTPVFAPEGSVIPAGCSRALTAPGSLLPPHGAAGLEAAGAVLPFHGPLQLKPGAK